MGLFSFLRNAGAKLFNRKKEQAPTPEDKEKIRREQIDALYKAVNDLGFEVENLYIDLQDETVVVEGTCKSQADKEKIVLALGNVEGIAYVDDRMNVVEPAPEATFYEVVKGDTLSKIAKAHYGDPMKYPIIFAANRPMLTHPDKIYPGQVLRIPALESLAAELRYYEVQKGDTLSKIAKAFYGDPMKYMAIFEANQPLLSNPDVIHPGQVLVIPSSELA